MRRTATLRLVWAALAASVALGGLDRIAGRGEEQAASAPRPSLPDTSDGIHLFADQLSPGYTDALVRFVATRYAGTQKMRRAENERFRRVNPRWVLLHYRLGSSSGPASYIRQDRWGSDWAEVTRHEDWFVHNAEGRRHHDPASNWDLHDLTNAAFREYWTTSVIADMRASGAQGVFADSFDAGVSGYGVTPPDARFAGTAPADPATWGGGPTWLQQKVAFMAHVADRFAAEPERFLFVPNVTLATAWWWPDYSRADGAMFEGFTLGMSPSDWSLSMDRALEFTRAGKFVIAQGYPRGVGDRLFLLASYLLIKGRHTFLNSAGAGVYFYPEYELSIGPAIDPLPGGIARYRWQGVYKREFERGVALVNPEERAVSVTFPAPLRLVRPRGGGQTTDADLRDGQYVGGTLAYEPLTALTLAPRSGAILLR